MVVVSVGDGGGGGGVGVVVVGGKYPSSTTTTTAPHNNKVKGDPLYDSDSGSDHSSSGRGSGGSDLGSEIDRERSCLEDSGRYSADGCEGNETVVDESIPPPSVPTQLSTSTTTTKHTTVTHKQEPLTRRVSLRSVPITHPPVDAPLCAQCARRDLSFFDPSCQGCSALLRRPSTTPATVFAVMRQWVPQVQHNIHHLVAQALSMGCHVDDRDALTDMTLLHYAVKAGSNGVGDQDTALQVVRELLEAGADVHQRCRWTHMTALHYAAYFDVAPVLNLLLHDPMGVCVNDACLEYSGGAPLHIAAANLCLAAVKVLLKHGALHTLTDTQGRTPFQCIPAPDQYELVPDVQDVITNLRGLLSPSPHSRARHTSSSTYSSSSTHQGSSGKAVLKAMGLKLGDRVLVSGVKTGTLRFVGTTEFATGLWAGVELETPTGRHNGTVKGVMYFRCAKNYGIFVPMNRLTKIPHVGVGGRPGRSSSSSTHGRQRGYAAARRSLSLPPGRVNHPRVDVSRVASRVAQDIRDTTRKIIVGDRVYVDMGVGSGSARVVTGTVRFTGAVHFASGFWVGVELDVQRGTNDGTVNGTRYFTTRHNHGIFAAPSRIIKLSDHGTHNEPDLPLGHASLRHSRSSLGSSQTLNNHPSTTFNPSPSRNTNPGRSYKRRPSSHGFDMQAGFNAHPSHSYPSNGNARPSRSYPSNGFDVHPSGPVSLGLPSPTHTISPQGPMSLGWDGALSGMGSGSHVNLCMDACDACTTSTHLLDDATTVRSAMKPQLAKTAIYPANTSMKSLNRSFSARYVTSRIRQEEIERVAEERRNEQTWCDPPILQVTPKAQRKKRETRHWLEIGHNVFYKNEVGTIKYIGRVDFEDGVWLGVELRAGRRGRHDGSVRGRRYFTCRVGHGIMVRPAKVYVRGINGASLVKPEDEAEE